MKAYKKASEEATENESTLNERLTSVSKWLRVPSTRLGQR